MRQVTTDSRKRVETDSITGYNLTYNYDVDNGKVKNLTCNAIPSNIANLSEPSGHAFFNRSETGALSVYFNIIPTDSDLAAHVSQEFSDIVSENETPITQ
ncbi:hypothetical protein LL912_00920 [Niabella sp. CC-SYL272]|uniref:hypothetical protein n=1 Tax=Niabella agricola TaxID=2891571 RepID=UPI001F440473|nr:hypothetical protein [Niabella agricola]MCF3107329.1 hypothetical protein [Niabella agricola]